MLRDVGTELEVQRLEREHRRQREARLVRIGWPNYQRSARPRLPERLRAIVQAARGALTRPRVRTDLQPLDGGEP